MPVFVDTNVLIYALDPRDPAKQLAAQTWMSSLWRERRGRLSLQVLNEFYVNLVRLLGASHRERARTEVRNLYAWQPWPVDEATLDLGWEIADVHGITHWDSLIVASAARQGCETLLSEDLRHGQVIEGVTITSPFVAAPGRSGRSGSE